MKSAERKPLSQEGEHIGGEHSMKREQQHKSPEVEMYTMEEAKAAGAVIR